MSLPHCVVGWAAVVCDCGISLPHFVCVGLQWYVIVVFPRHTHLLFEEQVNSDDLLTVRQTLQKSKVSTRSANIIMASRRSGTQK